MFFLTFPSYRGFTGSKLLWLLKTTTVAGVDVLRIAFGKMIPMASRNCSSRRVTSRRSRCPTSPMT